MNTTTETTVIDARYRVLTGLPGGEVADVFVAAVDDAGDDRLVVLKALRRAYESEASRVSKFRSEARLAARIQHPNVVEVYEVIEDRGLPVMVMEYLDGASLRELEVAAREAGRPLPLRARLEALLGICRGLHVYHELRDFDGELLGLVHRDVDAHNVFITVDDEAKLLGFASSASSGRTVALAPEQREGSPVDRRADVYAVGILLWEALAGRAMSDGQRLGQEVPEPEPVVEGCTPRLLDIASRCLAREPRDRFATCAALADALEAELPAVPASTVSLGRLVAELFATRRQRIRALLAGKTETSRAPSSADSHAQTLSASGASISHGSFVQSRSRRRLWVAGVGLLLMAGVVGYAVVPRLGADTETEGLAAGPLAANELKAEAVEAQPSIPAVPGPARSALPSPPEPVRISIDVKPVETAEVRLDGELLSRPYELVVPADDAVHTLAVSAPGHVSVSEELEFERDLKVTMHLEPAPEASDARRPTARRSARRPARRPDTDPTPSTPPASAPAPKANTGESCDPPFEVDERGFKRFKRHCL